MDEQYLTYYNKFHAQTSCCTERLSGRRQSHSCLHKKNLHGPAYRPRKHSMRFGKTESPARNICAFLDLNGDIMFGRRLLKNSATRAALTNYCSDRNDLKFGASSKHKVIVSRDVELDKKNLDLQVLKKTVYRNWTHEWQVVTTHNFEIEISPLSITQSSVPKQQSSTYLPVGQSVSTVKSSVHENEHNADPRDTPRSFAISSTVRRSARSRAFPREWWNNP